MAFARIFPLRLSGQYLDSKTYKARLFYDIESQGELLRDRDCEIFISKGNHPVHPWRMSVGRNNGDLSDFKTFIDSLCYYVFHELRYYLEAGEEEMKGFYVSIDFKDMHFSVFNPKREDVQE